MLLVAVVTAVVLVIASHRLVDAPLRNVTAELIQSTGLPWIGTALLVPTVTTVQVAVATFFSRYAQSTLGRRRQVTAPEVVRLTLSVI